MSDSEAGPGWDELGEDDPFASEHQPSAQPPAQRRRLGDLPEGLDAPVDKVAYRPVLTRLLEQDGGFFEEKASFSRIFGSRCIASVVYDVPELHDGLYQFLQALACQVLAEVRGLPAEEVERLRALLRGQCKISLVFPQLFQGAEMHNLRMDDTDAIEVQSGRVFVYEGYQFCRAGENDFALSVSATRAGAASITFECFGEMLKFEKLNSGVVTLTRSSGYDLEKTFGAPIEVGRLLEPETWRYNDVLSSRRDNAVNDRQTLDPQDLLLLQIAANLSSSGLVAGMLHIMSNGRFRSRSYKSKDGYQFELWVCGGNCIWSVDKGDAACTRLCKELQTQIGLLVSRPNLPLLVSALGEDGMLQQLKSEIVQKIELTTVNDVTVDHLLSELKDRCDYIGAQHNVMKPIQRASLDFKRLVQDETFTYDHTKQINFNDGWCFDVDLLTKRRIRPEDGATRFIGYPYPERDHSKQEELDAFMTEVHPDKGVRDFLDSRNAANLRMRQDEPTVCCLYGMGGSGKGLTVKLKGKAFGPYAVTVDASLFGSTRFNDPEKATPARARLLDKLYVCTDEVGSVDENTLKRYLGSGEISCRELQQGTKERELIFNNGDMMFNVMFRLKKCDGLDRRLRGIQHSTRFEYCKDEEKAKKMEEEWKRNGEEEEWKRKGEAGKATMYKAKYERIMALAPQLMARYIHIIQTNAFVDEMPSLVEQWTAELWAEAAPANLLQAPMQLWYARCDCTQKDPADDTTANLQDCQGGDCKHGVSAKTIMEKLGKKTMQSGKSLYEEVKGRSRSEDPILKLLGQVRIGEPPGCLRLAYKERTEGGRNVFFGLVELASAFPQQCMPADPM